MASYQKKSATIAIGPSSFAEHDQSPLKILMQSEFRIVPNPYGRRLTEEETIHHLKGIDGLIAGLEPLNEKVLSNAPDLKVIARVGIGMENVDLAAAKKHNITVSNTPDGPTQAVAELTLASLLSLLRELPTANEALHQGKWEKTIGRSLSEICVLIIGFGRIGRAVYQLLSNFGAKIVVFDPFIDKENFTEIEFIDLLTGLAIADVVSLHASGNNPILKDEEFDQLKRGAILLNPARGQLVCEKSLIKALKNKTISQAWFDTFWEEPYTGELLQFPNVLLTPHIATYTRSCRLAMETQAVKNLIRDLQS